MALFMLNCIDFVCAIFAFNFLTFVYLQGHIEDLFQFIVFYVAYTISVLQFGLCLITDRRKNITTRQRHIQDDREYLIENDQLQDDEEEDGSPTRKDPESVATALSLVFNVWFVG